MNWHDPLIANISGLRAEIANDQKHSKRSTTGSAETDG